MQLEKISLKETRSFHSFFLDYLEQKENLKPFYHRIPTIASFAGQLSEKQRSFPDTTRNVLATVLREQYKGTPVTSSVEKNIESLRDKKTFTVTTGHQLNIFTGPLYFIYKIVTVINACKKLKAAHPEYHFVPVYWMASEDHDYDEIKYFRLYGKKYIWKTEQTGAVGRFDTKDLRKLLDEIPGDITVFREAYSKTHKLSDAARHYVNALFGHEGLVVLDPDNAELKAIFNPVMQEDIFDNVSKGSVEKTDAALKELGYKPQVFCRDINFFYLEGHVRGRLEKAGDRFHVVNTSLSFSEAEIKTLIKAHPEKFSPNVILRPLYQEMILPNLAYTGGPAEVIYWLQLKSVFDHFQVPFPILLPRNFAMVIDHTLARKFEKTDLELKDLFEEKNYLFNHWVIKHSDHNLSVGEERNRINEIFESLKKRSEIVDKTLTAHVAAQGKRALGSLEKFEHKLLRAEKRLHTDRLKQIEAIKDALFPNGSLQERTDNFLNFYQQDAQFIQKLLDTFDPFDYRFSILLYPKA